MQAEQAHPPHGTSHLLSQMDEDAEVELIDYIRVILKRRRLILFGTLACALGAWQFELNAPKAFKGEAAILVRVSGQSSEAQPSYLSELLKSDDIIKSVAEAGYFNAASDTLRATLADFFKTRSLSETYSALSSAVAIKISGELVTVSAETSSPYISAQIANTYIEQIVLYSRLSRKTRVSEQLDFAEKRLGEVKAELETAEQQYANFLRSNQNLSLLPEISIARERFQREINIKTELYSELLKQHENLRIEAKKEAIVTEIIHKAAPLLAPSSAKKKKVAIAAAVGFMLAVFLAFFLEYLEKQKVNVGAYDILKGIAKTFLVWRKI